MDKHFDLVGVGIGPFHLSLAALMQKVDGTKSLFLDQKKAFHWHSELMFADADMQTSYLKDLVTPVDPTNPHSFLNYLVHQGLFYSFMNTNRKVVTRHEFEHYCQWVSEQMGENLKFNSHIESVDFKDDKFTIQTSTERFTSTNLSIATGLLPRIPECALGLIGEKVFHAKSKELASVDLTGKRVLVIGGGQTGVEVFTNALQAKWGRVKKIRLISRRQNLEPLDESPFTNEYFTPNYVESFFPISQESKGPIVSSQKLASDGNTPEYLNKLYNYLFQLKHVHEDDIDFKILPYRNFVDLTQTDSGFKATLLNNFEHVQEVLEADIVILSTGFNIDIPKIFDPIKSLINFDGQGRFIVKRNFDLDWKGPAKNKIYALNFSRHRHGIAEPQTSLMAWRSATIVNDMAQKEVYKINHSTPCFVQYGKIND